MAETKATVVIEKLEAKVKLVEEKEDGMVVDRQLVTEAKIQYVGTPAKLENILWSLKAGHLVEVTFASLQMTMPLTEEKAKALAKA